MKPRLPIFQTIFLLFFLIIIIIAISFNAELRQSIDDSVIYVLENEVTQVADEIDTLLYGMTELVDQMTINQSLMYIVFNSTVSEDIGLIEQEATFMLDEIHQTAPELDDLWVALPDADIIIDSYESSPSPAYNLSEKHWYHLIEEHDIIYTKPYLSDEDEQIVSIIMPVFLNDKLFAIFGADIQVAYLESLILESDFGQYARIKLILDKNLTYDQLKVSQKNAKNFDIDVMDTIKEDILSNDLGVVDLENYDLDEFLAYTSMNISDYLVIAVLDKAALNHQVNLLDRLTFTTLTAVLIGAVLLISSTRIYKNNKSLITINRKLEESEQALYKSNMEMEAAHQQLAASEARLHAQYNEIKDYTYKLETMKSQFEMAVEFTSTTVWEVDYDSFDTSILLGARSLKEMDIDLTDNPIKLLSTLFDPTSVEALEEALLACKQGLVDDVYCHAKYKDQKKWAMVRGKTVFDETTGKKILRGVIVDITELKKHQAQIEKQAETDFLTGLPNRRKFEQYLNLQLENKRSGAVLLMDLDNFKEINDTMGHAYGDEVLKTLSGILQYGKFKDQHVFRFGGDEFLMITNHESAQAVEAYANELIEYFKTPISVGNDEITVKFSIGATRFPDDAENLNGLLRNADLAMYDVKASGKNGFRFFDRSLLVNLQEKSDVEKAIKSALKTHGFRMVYQPQVESISGEVVSYEALIRLKSNKYYPDQFIPIAETSGYIVEIGRFVLKEVIKYSSDLSKMGIDMPIAVNISPKQLTDKSLPSYIKSLLSKYEVRPEMIELEITESLMLEDVDEVLNFLKDLKNLGIKISLDDFGTGYSSISYLTFLPIDKLKLDRSIIESLIEQDRQEVIRNIIEMAHNFDFQVVAEGVETLEQFKLLRLISCDHIQGYYFSKPIDDIYKQPRKYKV